MTDVYDDDAELRGELPGPLRAARVLLFGIFGIRAITVAAGVVVSANQAGLTAEAAGAFTYLALPGVLALICGLRLRKGRRLFLGCVVALMVLMVLQALSTLGQGNPQGFTQLILPSIILVLVLLPSSRAYLR
ncbi:peptidoglycan/LPS O-acetylase OafA/YrhL [Lipingzhangella halophila]|uniref:Peptidoglycan/LPS O-acetylase OafA/YrhL n=1 Tax=Lipingzhangella halophila TaxID=1783352 RepID=A0A7W7W405_9ACTN|nr:hypothetical protein [Lipingzhangella halophila]MBB4932250.1 peptidoglycan/LPS O-acetylase OafA/YrhL [Lipingzhangella halophila]